MVQAGLGLRGFKVLGFSGGKSKTWQAIIHEVKPLAGLCIFARIRVLLKLLDLACSPLIERLCSRTHHDAYIKHVLAHTQAHTHAHTHTREHTHTHCMMSMIKGLAQPYI
jgi:hypothetical protein